MFSAVISLLFGVLSVFSIAFIGGGLYILYLRNAASTSAPKGTKLAPVYSPGSIPFIDTFKRFSQNPPGFLKQGMVDLGGAGIYAIDMVVEKAIILTGHKYHKVFFEANDEDLAQAPVYQFMTPIFGPGVIYDASIEKRRQQVRALGACLKPSQLKKYSEIIAKEAAQYFKTKWGESGQCDLLPSMAELIILTASATLLGPEIRNELFLEVSHLYEMLDKGLTPISILFPHAPISAHKKRDFARMEIGKLFSKVIAKRRETDSQDGNAAKERIDMLQKLMEFEYKDGTGLTDEEITGLLVATLFAGQHTSSITTTWTTLFLLDDKKNSGNVYDKVMRELGALEQANAHPGDFATGQHLDYNVIQAEEMLYNCVKEAIRMFPPLILLQRRVQKEIITDDGYFIPNGSRLIVSNAVAGRLPEVFSDPDRWDPDRWNEFDMGKLPKYSFIGFGAGVHTCLGESFAFIQVRAILSVMLSMYEIDLVSDLPGPNYDAIVVPPKGPNIIKYKLRTLSGTTLKQKYYPVEGTAPKAIISKPDVDTAEAGELDPENTVYTMEEVAKHNKKGDAWLVVKGKVYNVSNYVHLHQGGESAILNYAGKPDATVAVYGPQHPKTVPTLLERYKIGSLASN